MIVINNPTEENQYPFRQCAPIHRAPRSTNQRAGSGRPICEYPIASEPVPNIMLSIKATRVNLDLFQLLITYYITSGPDTWLQAATRPRKQLISQLRATRRVGDSACVLQPDQMAQPHPNP